MGDTIDALESGFDWVASTFDDQVGHLRSTYEFGVGVSDDLVHQVGDAFHQYGAAAIYQTVDLALRYALLPEKYGGAGDDTIVGFMAANWLYGGGGNDTISAYGGYNEIYGGAGNDGLPPENWSSPDVRIGLA